MNCLSSMNFQKLMLLLGRQSLVLRRAKGIWWKVTPVPETPGSPGFNAWKHNLLDTKS